MKGPRSFPSSGAGYGIGELPGSWVKVRVRTQVVFCRCSFFFLGGGGGGYFKRPFKP